MTRSLIYVGLAAFSSVLVSAGCAAQTSTPATQSAMAALTDANGKNIGTAHLVQQADAILVTIAVEGLTPGNHGVHVHMTGVCEAPDFKSAGGHWNPASMHHGFENPQGHHAGDLPNLEVKADGSGSLSYSIAGATLSGSDNSLLDDDGAAVVVHAGPDDMVSDPAGNSGGRIACGVVKAE